ncbi:hypothetical protein ATANTOWER_009772 [Ataeniobius toweri]|uniref:Uncharacterized protein n=1 Tax=Ataeniobius toweri TaxID=208326 RepID=A0ABU7C7A8_9TELE|nr:hypothetical protein [Ataeniobius toweri]
MSSRMMIPLKLRMIACFGGHEHQLPLGYNGDTLEHPLVETAQLFPVIQTKLYTWQWVMLVLFNLFHFSRHSIQTGLPVAWAAGSVHTLLYWCSRKSGAFLKDLLGLCSFTCGPFPYNSHVFLFSGKKRVHIYSFCVTWSLS